MNVPQTLPSHWIEGERLTGLRQRGPWVAMILGCVSIIGFVNSFIVTPPVVSAVLVAIIVFTFYNVIAEYCTPGAEGSARPRVGWALCLLAAVVAFPIGFLSLFFERWASAPDACLFPLPNGDPPNICYVTTPAEHAGFTVWCSTIAATAVLLIMCAILTRRSRIAGWAAIPVALAGCVIAFDLAHAVVLALGKNTY